MVILSAPDLKDSRRGRRVEILGVFGSGKTTLAQNLTRNSGVLLPEEHERNPYWGDKVALDVLGYIAYDLCFLLQHAHLVASSPEGSLAVCDWSFQTDRLWASLRLGADLPVYDSAHYLIQQRLAPPVGYLFLRQTPETILMRLGARGRSAEQSFVSHVTNACDQLDGLVARLPANSVLLVDDRTDMKAVEGWSQKIIQG